MTARPGSDAREGVLHRVAGRVTTAVPGLDMATALELVTVAAGRSTLRQLDTHLTSHPAALISGASDAPMVVITLAALLADAGHANVRVPGCVSCGRITQRLRHRIPGGRACDLCYHRTHHAECSRCHRQRRISTRITGGQPLCDSCARGERREHCGQCGQQGRVARRRGDGAALCPNCYQTPPRQCLRCRQIAPTYAHTVGGPVCRACYDQPRRRCGGCGHHRTVDRRATRDAPDLCSRCNSRPTRPCTICRAPHPANPRARQPICLICRDAGHVLEPELTEAPPRTRRPAHQSTHDVLRSRLREVLTDPEHGIAEQLTPLIDAFDDVGKPRSVIEWLNGGPGSIRLHELAVRAHHEAITHELLDRYPQTNDLHQLRDLLVHTAILPERAELLDRNEIWLDAVLAQAPPQHTRIVRPFVTWHVLRRARYRARRRGTTTSAATWVRTQTLLALRFLSWLDQRGETLDTAAQADIDSWLDDGSRYHYLVSGFITWATARRLCTDLPHPDPQRPRRLRHRIRPLDPAHPLPAG